MATWSKGNQAFLADSKSMFEVPILATKDGNVVDSSNPLPVTLGSDNITITGSVNIGSTVEVTNDEGMPIPVSGTIDLSASTLSALETINVTDNNGSLTVDDGGSSLTVDGTVELGATSLAALETINVTDGGGSLTVDGTVDLGATSLAALENITIDAGEVSLSASSLAALENITIDSISGTVNVSDNGGSLTVDGSVSVSNFPATQTVDGTVAVTDNGGSLTVDGTVGVNNFPATQTVDGTVELGTTSLAALENITIDAGDVTVSNLSDVSFHAKNTDAFGRLRISNPFTLFESTHFHRDNGLWNEDNTGSSSSSFDGNEGCIDLTIGASQGDSMIRETKKVFSYQPGKSLLVMNTFVMATPKNNLEQRVGYYNDDNGVYLEQFGSDVYFVKRSSVTGTRVNTRIAQANWNGDKLDGTGASGHTLDLEKVQILYTDIEWLGAGSVRMGFVINGEFIIAHTFHHANIIDSTYMSTANLPIRYYIFQGSDADDSTQSVMKQICSTVISEGGYTLQGRSYAKETSVASPYSLATAGTYYPVASLRLNSGKLNNIAILNNISLVVTGNGIIYNWKLVKGGGTNGGSFTRIADESVETNLTGTSYAGGETVASGFISSSNQSSTKLQLDKSSLFKYQLESNRFDNTAEELTLLVSASTDTNDVYASIGWEEITR